MNKNSNIYHILYAGVMVLVVGVALAFVYMQLKPTQDENVANDTRNQILSALHIAPANGDSIKATYEKYITGEMLIDTAGNVVDTAKGVAFNVALEMKKNMKSADRKYPVLVCTLDDGSVKYVIPMYGAGLWGPIWGYMAVNSDGSTVYGANFSHEGETPGLGARIAEEPFQKEFENKQFLKDGEFKSVAVLKKGIKPTNGADYIDALSGATITSRGVSDMIDACVTPYKNFLMKLQGQATAEPATQEEANNNQPK